MRFRSGVRVLDIANVMMVGQSRSFNSGSVNYLKPNASLLKWIGNKFSMAEEISSYFPSKFGRMYDVFLGSGAILATVSPNNGIGSDVFVPLMEIWTTLQKKPQNLKSWYDERYERMLTGDKKEVYEAIKASYNKNPNGADFLFLCRSCYAGVIRFRKADGYMSTPCGPHKPIPPNAFSNRVDEWQQRLKGCEFIVDDYCNIMATANPGDLIYCDPPYSHSQAILYGAQDFSLKNLLDAISSCKERGVYVALSIDGTKKSGDKICELPIPKNLFKREVFIVAGRSMLKRLQMNGRTLENEVVADRLMLTY